MSIKSFKINHVRDLIFFSLLLTENINIKKLISLTLTQTKYTNIIHIIRVCKKFRKQKIILNYVIGIYNNLIGTFGRNWGGD